MVIDGIASLSVKSLTHPASAVTTILGIQPTSSAERGDPVGRLRTGADGKPSMRERTNSIWVLDSIEADPNDTSGFSSVRALVETLESKREALEGLRENYFIEVRWNGFSDRPQAGFLIPSELLAALGSLGCDFHGTVYLHADLDSPTDEAGSLDEREPESETE
jgi:hypothetical protein